MAKRVLQYGLEFFKQLRVLDVITAVGRGFDIRGRR